MPTATAKPGTGPPRVRTIKSFTAILPAAAFNIPGGFDVRIDLLDRLENEFANWSEKFVPPNSVPALLPLCIGEASFVFTILDVESDAQVARAHQIFLDIEAALARLINIQSSLTTLGNHLAKAPSTMDSSSTAASRETAGAYTYD